MIPKQPFDAEIYQLSTDWEQWYHEFSTERSGNGSWKYPSAFSFAQAMGKSRQERDFLLHSIGPVVKGKKPMFDTDKFPQYDWERARRDGHWIGPEHLKEDIARVIEKTDNLEELRLAGRHFLLPLLAASTRMQQKIEQAFEAGIFDPNGSLTANETRAKLYMRLTEDVSANTIRLHEAYARALGINMNDLMGTMAVREALVSKMRESGKSKGDQFFGKVVEMMWDKSEAMNLPMPDEDSIFDVARKMKA